MSRGNTLVLGIAVGAVGIILYTRLREVVEQQDPESLVDNLTKQIETLEARMRREAAAAREA